MQTSRLPLLRLGGLLGWHEVLPQTFPPGFRAREPSSRIPHFAATEKASGRPRSLHQRTREGYLREKSGEGAGVEEGGVAERCERGEAEEGEQAGEEYESQREGNLESFPRPRARMEDMRLE